MDPRENIIDFRFQNVKRIIAVAGGKGGIGKSMVSSTTALSLTKDGYKVGLLDLDFCGPSAHIILGIKGVYPEEKNGIIPPDIHNIKFMSIIYYTNNKPLPLRGPDISNAIIEILTITQWGQLDFLIIDMPPGIGDEILEVIRLIKKIEFLIVTTQSTVVLETVQKTVEMLTEQKIPITGIVENMRFSVPEPDRISQLNAKFLGAIDFDKNIEKAMGNVNEILKTKLMNDVKKISLSLKTKKTTNQ